MDDGGYRERVDLRPAVPADDIDILRTLFDVVAECDGHPPIGEHKYLDLLHAEPSETTGLVGESNGEIAAYVAMAATQEQGTWAIELAIHPLHRARHEVASLIDAAVARVRKAGGAKVRIWAFQPNYADILEAAGFEPERELLQLRRPLPIHERPDFPTGVDVGGFRSGVDDESWLRVNNAAFAGHPENGSWTEDILEDRKAQPWFDAEGIRMARESGELVGYCWTKIHEGVGEIYIIAVDPASQRRGLGRALVLEGLAYLGRKVSNVMLYVDSDNEPARNLYRELGFRLDHVDRSFVKFL